MGRLILIATIVLAAMLPATMSAQRLSDIERGARVRLRQRNGGAVEGLFVRAGNDSVTLEGLRTMHTTTTALASVKTVEVGSGRGHMMGALKGAWMGLAAGVISGVVIGAITYDHPDLFVSSRGSNEALGAFILGTGGLAAGTLIGAVVGTQTWKPIDPHLYQ